MLFFSIIERSVLMALVFYHKDMLEKVTMPILGDPGAVSGDGEKSKTGEKNSGDCSLPEFFIARFRLFPVPTNCPRVSEDERCQEPSNFRLLFVTERTQLNATHAQLLEKLRQIRADF